MKYFVLIPDGAADYPIEEIGGKTPFELADKPTLDAFAAKSFVGTVSNVPQGMVPESDTANLAILSYDPLVYSKGRSPLEAVSMGLTMRDDDIAFRCNVITLSEGEEFEKRKILDHSADEITTAEAAELIKAVGEKLGTEQRRCYPGGSYRHCMLWENPPAYPDFARPHDNIGNEIGGVLPPEPYRSLIRESCEILKDHPVNKARIARGLKPANSIWLWSPGGKPMLPAFSEKWGLKGTVVSAVDLIKGIGLCAGMESIDVEGATGNWKTNYAGKAEAAINAFKNGSDLVYVHVEAPDECGHRAELENKITCIGDISEKIMKPVTGYLEGTGEKYAVMLLPDHPTPICRRTHTMDPVPFMIYRSWEKNEGVGHFCEKTAAEKGFYLPDGSKLMSYFIRGEE
ncbi:MAG: cofactor-independent phosphoglycerate mutase [Firmicutes bacterium]|nr:cofactor-independent phosphoglycerate mutase [Candidatus Colimorpha enterica]